MNLNKLAFWILIVSILLVYFILSTFLWKSAVYNNNIILNNNNKWIFNISLNQDNIKYQKVEKIQDNSEIYLERINYANNIYSMWNYSIKDKTINLDKWVFFIDIWDLSKDILIKSTNFEIKLKSPWKFYIDLLDEKSFKIFSFDSILKLTLIDNADSSKLTNLELYPRMMSIFNVNRIKSVKRADLFRIENLFLTYYVSEKLFDENWLLNDEFLKKVWTLSNEISKKFSSQVFYINYNKNFLKRYSYLNLKPIEVEKVNWLDYIQNYFWLFVNENKKVYYYKNKIVNNLNKLFDKIDKNTLDETTKIIIDDVAKLKELWVENNIDDILNYYYLSLLKLTDINYIENNYAIYKIINKSWNLWISDFYINKSYYLINSWIIGDVDLSKNMLKYIEIYAKENLLSKENNYVLSIKWDSLLDYSKYYYLSFFIKNFLNNSIKTLSQETLISNLYIANSYISLNSIVWRSDNSVMIESFLVEQYTFLEKLLSWVKGYFFKDNLLSNWLLDLDKTKPISSEFLKEFSNTNKYIIDYFNINSKVLTDKTKIYKSKYVIVDKIYSELYSAIENYDDYVNRSKNDILTSTSVFTDSDDLVLDETLIYNYLSVFEWVSIDSLAYDVIDNSYYKISNLNINWDLFSFNLYPFDFYKIDNISKNWTKLSFTYELDSLKKDLWENKFKKFFINTFYWNVNQNNTNQSYVKEEDEEVTESKQVLIFKRDKLFWPQWDFTFLKWILSLKYNDVLVTDNAWWFDIKILRSQIQTKKDETNSDDSNINWILTSDYVFNSKDRYFKNINISFSDLSWVPTIAWWNILSIEENIDLINLNKRLKEIANNIKFLDNIYNQIFTDFWVNILTINYSKNDNLKITFEYKWKNISILLKWSKILNLWIWTNNFLNNKIIDYTELNQYFNLIK